LSRVVFDHYIDELVVLSPTQIDRLLVAYSGIREVIAHSNEAFTKYESKALNAKQTDEAHITGELLTKYAEHALDSITKVMDELDEK